MTDRGIHPNVQGLCRLLISPERRDYPLNLPLFICPICLEPIHEGRSKVNKNGIEAHSECFDTFPEEIEDGRE
jgi:hypothetical protein